MLQEFLMHHGIRVWTETNWPLIVDSATVVEDSLVVCPILYFLVFALRHPFIRSAPHPRWPGDLVTLGKHTLTVRKRLLTLLCYMATSLRSAGLHYVQCRMRCFDNCARRWIDRLELNHLTATRLSVSRRRLAVRPSSIDGSHMHLVAFILISRWLVVQAI